MGEKKNIKSGKIPITTRASLSEWSAVKPINGFKMTKVNLLNIEIEDKTVARFSEGMNLFI